jgi:hypothetical protein
VGTGFPTKIMLDRQYLLAAALSRCGPNEISYLKLPLRKAARFMPEYRRMILLPTKKTWEENHDKPKNFF